MPMIDDLMNRRPVREPAGWDEDKKVSNVTGTFGKGLSNVEKTAEKPQSEEPQNSAEEPSNNSGESNPSDNNDNKPQ